MVKPSSRILVAISTVADGTMLDSAHRDDPNIIANRKRWLNSLGVHIEQTTLLRISYQHGDDYCRYAAVSPSQMGEGMFGDEQAPFDAFVTTTPGHALFLPVADCVATTLFDPVHSVLMLSHLGRHSLEQQGGVKSVEYLIQNFDSDPKDIQVWLSPAVGKDSYQIYTLNNMGMKEALYAQLTEVGIDATHITDLAHDTATHDDYYSHSAFLKGYEAKNGRVAMVATMLPK